MVLLDVHRKLTMQSLTADLVIFMLCLTLPQLVSPNGFSKSAVNFMAILNGDYDNLDQWQEGFGNHSFIQFRVVPVDIPALQPAVTWYVEWAADGKVLHMQIGVITDHPGDGIYITLYNFTDTSLYKPGEFNVSTLSGLKSTDLRGSNCTAMFERLTKVYYVGYWPDCRSFIRGNHPNYADTVSCRNVSIVIPPTVEEKFTESPYMFLRTGQRYRYSRLPDNYASICGGKQ